MPGEKAATSQGLRHQGSGQNPSSIVYELWEDGHANSPKTQPVSLSVQWVH